MSCPACEALAKCVAILEGRLAAQDTQIATLQQQVLAMSGDAAERYHRLRMTEVAHLHPMQSEGMLPMEQGVFRGTPEEETAEAVYQQIMGN